MEGRLINVRRLVSLDITLHGPRFILIEFGLGTPAILLAGLWLVTAGAIALGWYLVLTGFNYLPLLAYAVIAARRKSWKQDVEAEMAADKHYVRKYSVQQVLLFVPLVVLALAVVQLAMNE